MYLTPPASVLNPQRELVGFERVHLQPGQTTEVGITLDPRQLSLVDTKGARKILPGRYRLSIGGAQPGHDEGLPFEITGTKPLPE